MTDSEITVLCAEAMALSPIAVNGGEVVIGVTPDRYVYYPLHDDAQAMELVKKFALSISWPNGPRHEVTAISPETRFATSTDYNRAICECVAKMQLARRAT